MDFDFFVEGEGLDLSGGAFGIWSAQPTYIRGFIVHVRGYKVFTG